MTKTGPEQVKINKKQLTTTRTTEGAKGNNPESSDSNGPEQVKTVLVAKKDPTEVQSSSEGSENETETDEENGTSDEDTDQILGRSLDIIEKQASESASVVLLKEPKVVVEETEKQEENGGDETSELNEETGERSDDNDLDIDALAELVQKREKKTRKVGISCKTGSKGRLSKKPTANTLALNILNKLKVAATDPQTSGNPPVSPRRLRQQKAVLQAKKRIGLSTKYERLSTLLELHRLLLQGNPFKLIDPKQVYPYFYMVPGINLQHIQVLVKAWQEKAIQILYQLLLIETKCDIARIKRRTDWLTAKPELFHEILQLKVDIGLENIPPAIDSANVSEKQSQMGPTTSSINRPPKDTVAIHPPAKKSRK